MKLLFIFSFITTSLWANAQSTLAQAERYAIGESYIYLNLNVSETPVDIENPTNWNFTAGLLVTDTTIMTIEDRQIHDPENQHPEADFVEVNSDGTKVFCKLEDSLCKTIGFRSGKHHLSMVFAEGQIHMDNRLIEGDSMQALYQCDFTSYGHQYTGGGMTKITYIAKGSLDLAVEKTVHLVKVVQTQQDSSWLDGSQSNLQTTTYVWLIEGQAAPVMRYSISESSYGTYRNLSYLHAKTLGETNLQPQKVTVYPNPSRDVLYWSGRFETYRVLDQLGREVKSGRLEAPFISVQTLPTGKYVLHLEGQNSSSSIVFIKH